MIRIPHRSKSTPVDQPARFMVNMGVPLFGVGVGFLGGFKGKPEDIWGLKRAPNGWQWFSLGFPLTHPRTTAFVPCPKY